MYVTNEAKHLAKSLQQGVSQIKILINKIPHRRMYVADEAKHLAKSLQQGVSQKKITKVTSFSSRWMYITNEEE